MKNIKSYLHSTHSTFTSQEENFFEQQLLKLTIAERTSFNGYLFYSNFYETIKASHKTIANGKISESSQIRATKKFKRINLIKRIKTHHRRPLTTIVNPIIYNLSFRKRMAKYFPLFKYLPETLLFSLSISNSVFNTLIAKASIDSPFNILSSKDIKSELVSEVYVYTDFTKNTYKEASPTTNRKVGEKRMLQVEISPLLTKIAHELKFTQEQIERISEYHDGLLQHAYKHSLGKKEPFSYFLKVCVSEVSNPRFKHQEKNSHQRVQVEDKPFHRPISEQQFQVDAAYYSVEELEKKIKIYTKLISQTQNSSLLGEYQRSLDRWLKVLETKKKEVVTPPAPPKSFNDINTPIEIAAELSKLKALDCSQMYGDENFKKRIMISYCEKYMPLTNEVGEDIALIYIDETRKQLGLPPRFAQKLTKLNDLPEDNTNTRNDKNLSTNLNVVGIL